MKTKCQWCRNIVDASPELVAAAQAGDMALLCPPCKIAVDQNLADLEEYEREYTERLKQQWEQQHAGKGVTL